jgi:quercetin dioxygenase-like cupin family protein
MGVDKERSHQLMKFVKGALDLPCTKVVTPSGQGDGVDGNWYQLQLLNPPDSNDVMDAATAEHRSNTMFDTYFWYHQFAIVLGGEMVAQDLDTGDVYRGHEGDVFYWAPGLSLRLGGDFRALGIKTPIPLRWVKTPEGKREVTMHLLDNEILLDGSPPDEVRDISGRVKLPTRRKNMKFIRDGLKATPVKVDNPLSVDNDWWQVVLVGPMETNLTASATIANHRSKSSIVCDHQWHQVAVILDGEMEVENLDTGELYRGHKGDMFYWAPGLRHTVGGEFLVYAVKTPEPLRWMRGSDGNKEEVNLLRLGNEIIHPGTPPDEIRMDPIITA